RRYAYRPQRARMRASGGIGAMRIVSTPSCYASTGRSPMNSLDSSSLWSSSLLEFRERVAAGTPTPGGGAVAAVTATFAAALLRMVATICAHRTPDVRLDATIVEVKICEEKLAGYADEDVRAFDAFMAARKNQLASEKLQALLLACAHVPLEAAEQVEKLQSLTTEIAAKCPAFLASDVATARHLLHASREALLANVAINCKDLEECEEKRALEQRLERLRHAQQSIADLQILNRK
ncbi:MAG TPA: cyclodeaminase/cyclohydrolase family protein, partial [Acidobacteriaceae bacterium]|nr:cyclodeaminase/cyclohydrolase family protein [Acidobacteriaceae bacterium]